MNRIGFIGVGVMGSGMASCLLKAGYPLSVVAHHNRQPVEQIVAQGAVEMPDYASLVAASDVIILCVSNSKVVEDVIKLLKPFLRADMIVIDTGTSQPSSIRALNEELSALAVKFVEAPVTGGVVQAAAGELGALVGAKEEHFIAVKPLLQTFCKTVHHFGLPGVGNSAKLLNNFMVMGIASLVIESFTKADQAGIDWQKLYDVVICGSADSGVLRRMIGGAVEGDFKRYVFDVNGAQKDINYFCDLAEELGGVSSLAVSVQQVFKQAVDDGHGQRLLSELLSPEVLKPGQALNI